MDLNGQSAVINHPVTLRFSTTELVTDGKRIDLLRNFIVVQPAPLWSDYSLTLDARSSALTALSNSRVKESTAFDFSVSRLPWGDRIHLDGEGLEQSENFAFEALPTSNLIYAPPLAFGADLGGVAGGLRCGSPVNPSSPSLLPLSRIGFGALGPSFDHVWIPAGVYRYGGASWAYLVGNGHCESSSCRWATGNAPCKSSEDTLPCMSNDERRNHR